MTVYRQQALMLARALATGPQRPRDLAARVPTAAAMLRRNVYGWFERTGHGVYALTPQGHEALMRWP
jgi:hypothetical protein